jgi:hypothetical protein
VHKNTVHLLSLVLSVLSYKTNRLRADHAQPLYSGFLQGLQASKSCLLLSGGPWLAETAFFAFCKEVDKELQCRAATTRGTTPR